MKKLLAFASLLALSGLMANSQTLLYQWAFTNSADTTTNSAATFAWTPGTGDLILTNVSGDVSGQVGLDAVNPLIYFTNSVAGPGSGPGVDATGALVVNGQGYNTGPTAIAMATNLNLGSLNQITVTFWVQLGSTVPGQFPRFVQFYQSPAFDVGGKGSGNHNGVGASINGWSGATASQEQNGIANTSSGQQSQVTITGNPSFSSGFQADGVTWYFEAITYDGTLTANNFITWIGTLASNVQPFVLTANYGSINLTTNATVMIGGNDVPTAARSLSSGAIADVRIYGGVLTSNMLENIRQFNPDGVIPPGSTAPTVTAQPASGSTFVSGSRTFSVTAIANPPTLTYLWHSNGVAIPGATNSTFTLTNVQLAANGATFLCSVTNIVGGTNSTPATLTVVQPVAGSYADAIFTNQPYSFWLVNEASNSTPINISDYANGHDGQALNPTNNLFTAGPAAPNYAGFASTNTAIETLPNLHSELNMADPGNFSNTGMTICGWINTPGLLNGNGLIFDLVSDTAGGFGLLSGSNDGQNNLLNYQWGANSVSTGLSFPTNEWTFIALVVSTNLTQADLDNSITADTNVLVYVGSHSTGLQSFTDSSAFNGSSIASAISASPLALGRTTFAFSENSPTPSAVNDAQFNAVAVYYKALPAQTVTNLYLKGAGLFLLGTPDPNIIGNFLLTYPMGTLQDATNVTGPYSDVNGAASPFSAPMTDPLHFFRVRN
jgi:hypothetical protein